MQVIPVDREVAEVARASGRPLTLVGVDSLRESELRCSLGICVCVLISVWNSNNTIRVYLFLKRYYNKSKQKTNSVEYLSTNERELDIISCRHSGRRQLLPCPCPRPSATSIRDHQRDGAPPCCHLCRVAGNTASSYMAREFQ